MISNKKNEYLCTIFLLTYNHETTIRKTIESILAQKTQYPFIVKILEDCSTDKTLNICKEYVEKYPDLFKLIAQPVNTKGEHSRWAKEKEINSPYWTTIEGDDWYLNELYFEKSLSFMESHKNYSCYCGDVLFGKIGENNSWSCVIDEQNKTYDTIGHELSFKNYVYIHPGARMYRNIFDFKKLKKIPLKDIYLWYLYLDRGKVFFEHEIMSQYNINPAGMWNKNTTEQKLKIQINSAIVCNEFFKYKYAKFFAKQIHDPKLKKLKKYFRYKIAMWIYTKTYKKENK